MSVLSLARDLRRRKARERHGTFVAEGLRTVSELLASPLPVRGALHTPDFAGSDRGAALIAQLRARGVEVQAATDAEFASAAATDSPQGILAIGVAPSRSISDLPETDRVRVLVLDAVQDPGNVGTIIRTAAALGATATFSLPGTVDLWNAKVVRSAMGAHFDFPCLNGTWDELDEFRRERSVALWAADASGESVESAEPPARLALVVGNEGAGLSSHSRTRADRIVALPIASAVESLNVAVAAGILLYELRR